MSVCFCPPDTPDHELRGPAGRPGVRPGQGALPGTQPSNPLRLHRRHRGETAWWLPAVLAVPRSLRQDGRPPLQRESGKKIGKETIPDWQPLRSFRVEALQPGSRSSSHPHPYVFSRWIWRSMGSRWIYTWSWGTTERPFSFRRWKTIR